MTVLDDQVISYQGEKVRAKKVEFSTEGIVTYQWFDEEGNFLKGEMFSGLMLEAATEEYIKDKHYYFLVKIRNQNDKH